MDKENKLFKAIPDIIIWLLIGAYTIIFCYLSFLKFYSFGYLDWDFASDLTILWNSVHGRPLYYPFLEQNIFGFHLYLIIFPILLVYKIAQHPLTLLFLQSLFLGLAAYPLYLFASSKLNKYFACAISLAYLLYPSIGFINLFETHFEIYEIFFLFFAILYFEKGHFKKFMIFILLALLCKENVSLVVFMFGFYALIRRKSIRWVLTPLLLGATWFLLSVKVIIPHFAKDAGLYQEGFIFSAYYRHLGGTLPEMFQTILLHPVAVFHFAFSSGKILYPFILFLPTCFLGIFSPGPLLMTLPVFAQNLLSSVWTHSRINYQYAALIVPFIFVSTVWSFKKILALKSGYAYRRIVLAVFLLVSAAAAFFLNAPQLHIWKYAGSFSINDSAREKERLVSLIPPEASVMASFRFLPHLAERKNIFSLHLLSSGYKMYSRAKYIPPQGLEYLLVDFNEPLLNGAFFPPSAPLNIRTFLKNGAWHVWQASDDVVLFSKDKGKVDALCQVVPFSLAENKFNLNFAGRVAFLGYDLIKEPPSAGALLHFVYYWRRLGDDIPPLGVFLQFLGPNGEALFQRAHYFGYRIYPPDSFAKGEIIREHYYASVPYNNLSQSCRVRMGLFDLRDGQLLPIDQNEQADISGKTALLGEVSLRSKNNGD